MALKLRLVSYDGSVARVATEGDVVVAGTSAESNNPLVPLLGQGWESKRVLIDFTKTGHIDSAGIGWLIGSARRFRKDGGALVVHSVTPWVRNVLDMLKISQVVPIAANETEGLQVLATVTSNAGAKQ